MNNKKLYRSKNDRIIRGVCGGLGEYSGINSYIIRGLFLIAAWFTGGMMIFVYIMLSSAIPEEGQEGQKKVSYKGRSGIGALINFIGQVSEQAKKGKNKGIKSDPIKYTILSQEIKNEYSQKNRVELEGHQNRSGIDFDWRSKILILLLIAGVVFLLWKFGFIGANFNF